ncbi:MAG: uL15 family ribosomal protein [Patescibacteria group bacterium]
MQLHQLQPKHKHRKSPRIGRGGSRGTFSGRGTKGQKARSGRRIRPAERDFIMKFPKKRGHSQYRFENPSVTITLARVAKAFADGGSVNPRSLKARGVISGPKQRKASIKIVGTASVKSALMVSHIALSKTAADAITKAGGKVS